jgi:hypothetical protein
MTLLSLAVVCTSLLAPPLRGGLAVRRNAAPSMGLFNLKAGTARANPVVTAEEDEMMNFPRLKFLRERIGGKIKRAWRALRGKSSPAVTDLIVTAELRRRSDAKKADRRRVSGKTTSWEEHLMPAAPMVPRRYLAEDSWENMLPAMSVLSRDLTELDWEGRLLPALGEDVVEASSPPTTTPSATASAAPAEKRNLAEVEWEERLVPGEAPTAAIHGSHQLAETSWEETLLPSGVKVDSSFEHVRLSSWEDKLLP